MSNGKRFFDTYVAKMPGPTIVEIGSQNVNGSLREVSPAGARYIGLDFVEGEGVDVVLSDPYRIPLDPETADVVVCSSCFEHSEMFWLVFLEALRILKPGGVFYINVPSNGAFHRYPVDCWRFYPDSGHAMVTWAQRNGLRPLLLESYTARQHSDIWNDFVAVFLKDERTLAEHPDRILATHDAFENGWMHGGDGFLRENNFPEDLQRIQDLGNELTERNGQIQEWQQRLGDRNQQATKLIRSLVEQDSPRLRSCLESDWYRERNPDLAQHRGDPYEHWLAHGAAEGRPPCEDPLGLAWDLIQDRILEAADRRAADLQQSFAHQLDAVHATNQEGISALKKEYDSREQVLHEVMARNQNDRLEAVKGEVSELLQAQGQHVAERDAAHAERQNALQESIQTQIDALASRIEEQQQVRLDQVRSEISDLVRLHAQGTATQFDAVSSQIQQQRESLESQIGALESRIEERQQSRLDRVQNEISDLVRLQAQNTATQFDTIATQIQQQREFLDAQIGTLESRIEALQENQERHSHQTRQEMADLFHEQERRAAEHDRTVLAALQDQQERWNAKVDAQEAQTTAHNQHLHEAFRSWIAQTEQLLQIERDVLRTQYDQSLESLKQDLNSLESSMSWHLSAPIRAIMALFGSKVDLPRVAVMRPAPAPAGRVANVPERDSSLE